MSDSKHSVYFDLQEALAGPGCAICGLTLRGLRRYFTGLAYESVNDIRTRDELRQARGFCEPHGRILRESSAVLGSAIIHRDVIAAAARDLGETTARSPSLGGALRQAFGGRDSGRSAAIDPQQRCPACVRRESVEDSYVDLLLQRLDEAQLLPAFRSSAGLCMPHLRLALRRAPNDATSERLKSAQLTIWASLIAELDEFIRKQDYRFAAEAPGPEASSWTRAIDLVSGELGVGREREK